MKTLSVFFSSGIYADLVPVQSLHNSYKCCVTANLYTIYKGLPKLGKCGGVRMMRKYYFNGLHSELGLCSAQGKPTYAQHAQTSLCKDILDNHRLVLSSFAINITSDEQHLPSMYWTPKVHKTPYEKKIYCRLFQMPY